MITIENGFIVHSCNHEKEVAHMNNIIDVNERRKSKFTTFVKENKSKIYANTPKVDAISIKDEWANETEWDELFHELSAKEN